jgi:hypothetical protein
MLDLLDGAGNTTTLAGYLELLASAGLASGLPKHDAAPRRRGSSPKLLALNGALLTAVAGWAARDALADAESRGRLIETAVGAHLANAPPHLAVGYWREASREVDYVVAKPGAAARRDRLLAVRVESGRRRESRSGLAAFGDAFPGARSISIGDDGVAVEAFLSRDPLEWLA